MNDLRRLNVAVSRARRKLIIVGHRETVQGYSSWQKLLTAFRPDQFVKVTKIQPATTAQSSMEKP